MEHENGLDKALFECYKATIVSLAQRGLYIREKTIETYNYFYDIIQQ